MAAAPRSSASMKLERFAGGGEAEAEEYASLDAEEGVVDGEEGVPDLGVGEPVVGVVELDAAPLTATLSCMPPWQCPLVPQIK